MREIGSEFWSVPTVRTDNHFFPAHTRWFQSGRSALTCILADIQSRADVKTAALPAWCCDSMVKPFVDAGICVRFYPVYPEGGKLVQDLAGAGDCDILFVMDYFGYSGQTVSVGTDAIVIRDLTHGIFSGYPNDARYYFGSLRKWAGFYTGGFAWGVPTQELPEDTAYVELRKQAMEQKQQYLQGVICNKDYLGIFGQAEEMLEHGPAAKAYEPDIALAEKLDISGLKQQRRNNAAQLLEAFGDMAIFSEIGEHDCPLFVPILVPNGQRDALRKYLIQHQIYCPVHWPLTEYHRPDERTGHIYQNELSLVCDQRYREEDMARLIETVKRFWKD